MHHEPKSALVFIACAGSCVRDPQRLPRALAALAGWGCDLTIEVHVRTGSRRIGLAAETLATQVAKRRAGWHFSVHSFDEVDGLRLTWRHRERIDALLRERGAVWDAFGYLEDDIVLSWQHVLAWAQDEAEHLGTAATGGCGEFCSRAFVRWEHRSIGGGDDSGPQRQVVLDFVHPLARSESDGCTSRGGRSFLLLGDGYQGFWLLTRRQLLAFRSSACWVLERSWGDWRRANNDSARLAAFRSGAHNVARWWGDREVAAAGPLACRPHPCVPVTETLSPLRTPVIDPLAAAWHASESFSAARLSTARLNLTRLFARWYGSKQVNRQGRRPQVGSAEAASTRWRLPAWSDDHEICPTACQPACLPWCRREWGLIRRRTGQP